ncbi:hypothetical protein BH23GEM6_BH23GEM6_11030 [soil metagenome]
MNIKINTKGFTLIELMIVVVIIGILAAIAIPKFGAASERAKEKEADGILKQVFVMQEAYRANNGVYTAAVADLVAVGYEAPTAAQLKNFEVPVISATCVHMVTTGSHNSRNLLYATGTIGNGVC